MSVALWSILLLIPLMLILLGMSIWVSISLFITALIGIHCFASVSAIRVLATIGWNSTDSWALVALPLFVFMGELLVRTRISEKLFAGLAPWLSGLPGSLLHLNIVSSTMFAAVSGSSAATAATIGKINIPELLKRGYDPKLVVGSLGGAGTLGFLIPPSLIMIVYGVLAEVSIGRLFMAGVLPGLMMATGFMLYLGYASSGGRHRTPQREVSSGWGDRFRGLGALAPTVALILLVLGSIYTGLATPTESAALGVLGALLLGFVYRTVNLRVLKDAVLGAVRTTCMIGLIVAGASVLSTAMGYLGIPRTLAEEIALMNLSPYMLMFVLALFYLLLGLFLDGISMVVITLPITLPLILSAGFDPIWFGIFLVMMVEAAQITPPVGFNLFVIQGISGYSISYVAKAVFPFFLVLLGLVVLLTVFPGMIV